MGYERFEVSRSDAETVYRCRDGDEVWYEAVEPDGNVIPLTMPDADLPHSGGRARVWRHVVTGSVVAAGVVVGGELLRRLG